MIGVKKSFAGVIDDETEDDLSTYDIDLLLTRCQIKDSEKIFTVIGCRMTTGGSDLKQQYNSERKAFDNQLLPKIKEVIDSQPNEVCILSGDFNNASHHGWSLNKSFDEVQKNTRAYPDPIIIFII